MDVQRTVKMLQLFCREQWRRPTRRKAGYHVVAVLGHPSYYRRFGFSKAKDYGLDNEYNAQDAFMVMELKPDVLRGLAGLVQYAPEFREAGC